MQDKRHIELAFLDNVEASRMEMLSSIDRSSQNASDNDAAPCSRQSYTGSIFLTYAIYWDNTGKKHLPLLKPANEWLDVEVCSISYSADSLKCVALVTVNERGSSYSGHAIVGLREQKDKPFKIYPDNYIILKNYPYKFGVIRDLKSCYHNLKGEYKCGINNPRFFETAPEFYWIDSLNLYRIQTDIFHGERFAQKFYSNQDSTINKHFFND